jgi:uncharacterized lipoprotein YehR (DUF1307 family)
MKKLALVFSALALVFSLAGCGNSLTVGSFSSLIFNIEDYDAAIEEVQIAFQEFEGCTMSKIGYAGDKAVREEANGRGLAPEQVIVLKSTFKTDKEDHQNGLEPDHTYEDFLWILTRGTSADPLEVTDHGY